MYSPLWKITHQKPSVLCTPPFEKSLIKTHRFCVLPPLKTHPSNPIGFVYSPLWKITVFGGRLSRRIGYFSFILLCRVFCLYLSHPFTDSLCHMVIFCYSYVTIVFLFFLFFVFNLFDFLCRFSGIKIASKAVYRLWLVDIFLNFWASESWFFRQVLGLLGAAVRLPRNRHPANAGTHLRVALWNQQLGHSH